MKSAEVVSALLDRFTTAPIPTGPVEDVVAGLGWEPTGRQRARWREWSQGDLLGYTARDGATESFSVVTVLLQPDDGDDFEELYGRFEAEVEQAAAEIAARLGPATSRSVFGEPEVPVEQEFDRAVLWSREGWSAMVTFQHEDKESPMRLAFWVFREVSARPERPSGCPARQGRPPAPAPDQSTAPPRPRPRD